MQNIAKQDPGRVTQEQKVSFPTIVQVLSPSPLCIGATEIQASYMKKIFFWFLTFLSSTNLDEMLQSNEIPPRHHFQDFFLKNNFFE